MDLDEDGALVVVSEEAWVLASVAPPLPGHMLV